MQFNFNYSAPDSQIKVLSNFRGVDYTKAELDISENRAYQMQNFIFKDGINQKRNGYKEIFQVPNSKPINGYWEFVDSKRNVHRIVHAKTTFYRLNFGSDTLEGNYYTNTYETLEINYTPNNINSTDWAAYISGIKDRKSFGVVRGDRLYIFCGIMCVYGSWDNGTTWELRAVRDNIDTYIPTTTTNITHNAYTGESTRASLEEVNMMSTYRINKLYGDISNYAISSMEDYSEAEPGSAFAKTYNKGYLIKVDVNNVLLTEPSKMFLDFYVQPEDSSSNDWHQNINFDLNLNATNITFTNSYGGDYIKIVKVRYKYEPSTSQLLVYVYFGAASESVKNRTTLTSYLNTFNIYQLDSKNIARTTYPPVLNITTDTTKITIQEWNDSGTAKDSNGSTINDIVLDFEKGLLKLSGDYRNKQSIEPNIEIKFTTIDFAEKAAYEKIDNCTTGIIFGYNGIEHLFVSGNDDYPNMDWHTSESLLANDNYNLPNSQNLTYFSDLSYAYLGSPQTKVKSYLLLNDNTLGVLKEYSPTESSLYIREPYVSDALDPSGNVVYDASGTAYQKIYYKQYFSAIGEGCISSYASSNLSGDKVFLSKNGLYGIELDLSNISSNQRYAKERSRKINPVLETYDAETLKNATSIVHNNRYYLSMNDKDGTVFIADARFRNGGSEEMNDTLGYEWWVWKNVKAHIWYIDLKGNLCFGDEEGRLYSFEEENNFKDTKYIKLSSGDVSYVPEGNYFVYSNIYTDLIKKCKKIHFETVLEEIILTPADVISSNNNYIYINSDAFYNKLLYFVDKKLKIVDRDDKTFTDCYVKSSEIDYENKSFMLRNYETDEYIQMTGGSKQITSQLDDEVIYEIDEKKSTFQLIDHFNNNVIEIFDNNITNDQDLECTLIFEENVKAIWYTPYMNFGISEYNKTLRYITLTPQNVLHGSAKLSILTKGKNKDIIIEGVDVLSILNNLSLNSFSLEVVDFAKSFTKKVKIRNFNFIMLNITSDNDKNFAIHSIELNYVVSKRNKGVS